MLDQDCADNAPSPPLFRPEAIEGSEYGEAFAFKIPGWASLAVLAATAVALFFAYSFFANFDRVSRVRGIVVPTSGVSRIVAPQTGIVTAVFVRQGASVSRGAPIVRIASSSALPNGALASGRVLETYRLQQGMARAGQEAERQRSDMERERVAEQAAALSVALGSLDEQIAVQRERIANNEQRLSNLATLQARGYVADVTYQAQQEVVLGLRLQMAELRRRRAEADHGSREARLRSAELAMQARRVGLDAAASLMELERGAASAQVAAEVTVAAPMAGTVSALRVSPGMAIAASENIGAVVRSGEGMEALLFVPSEAAGTLRPGQEIVFRYDAFPYQRYGVGHGVIVEVASSANVEQRGAPPTYQVRARISDGGHFALRPDMTLSADITLERRSLLEWFLAPLRAQWREGQGLAGP